MALVCALLTYVNPAILQVLFWPVLFPLESGFGGANWLPGFTVGIILVVISFGLLHFASARINLSRAAQESRFKGDDQRISWLGGSINQQVKLRERLESGIVQPDTGCPCLSMIWRLGGFPRHYGSTRWQRGWEYLWLAGDDGCPGWERDRGFIFWLF
jgi:hypothetical protein